MERWCAVIMIGVLGGLCAGACGSGSTSSTDEDRPGTAEVVEVIDGDTIDVEIAGHVERVRLLGIDTPEITHPGEPGECFGAEAHRRTGELLPPGTPVLLERDIVGRDDYGRLLAHVYRADDGVLVNERLVADGYATPLIIEPNVAGRRIIVDAARSAQARRLGIWSSCTN